MTHRDLEVYKIALLSVKDIYTLSAKFPSEEKFGLTSQIRRAIVSVPSNIAEGATRNSTKEFIQFLYIALGSLSEVETQLEIAKLLGFTPDIEKELACNAKIRMMILSLIKSLKNRINR